MAKPFRPVSRKPCIRYGDWGALRQFAVRTAESWEVGFGVICPARTHEESGPIESCPGNTLEGIPYLPEHVRRWNQEEEMRAEKEEEEQDTAEPKESANAQEEKKTHATATGEKNKPTETQRRA
ncbi:hypothetical protein NDU88_006514 [Pleurodeles waltl]|uniref:Uncharacterized protein n=1 Tax=Pleurodeles waltl TaxID=8319 RepID=A0AAV7VMY9_PLEWA|nr:hypothetical protein NDU88_006514 [Pleurodeles waltl]